LKIPILEYGVYKRKATDIGPASVVRRKQMVRFALTSIKIKYTQNHEKLTLRETNPI